MKKLIAIALLTSAATFAQANPFNADNLDYRNIPEGPESPIETKNPHYPVTAYLAGTRLVIENTTKESVAINGFMFDSAGCEDLDLPKDRFRLPAGGVFIADVGHCPANSMRWVYLNVGKFTKKFNLAKGRN